MSKQIDYAWQKVMSELPYQKLPYSKKNWGNPNHSLCSYQGKLKPAIASFLVNTFVPQNGKLLDTFSGVGTIPFEGALSGKKSFGFDISPLAYYVSFAKLNKVDFQDCLSVINELNDYIRKCTINEDYYNINASFGYNKTLSEYYNKETFNEILSARQYFSSHQPQKPAEAMVLASLLHILHGNRPYALSRKSHPIVPYAPNGEFIYKNLIEKVTEKVKKSTSIELPENFINGDIFLQDTTKKWPDMVSDLDAIITSPPFFDSTKFYMANWIRLWFTGWDKDDFETKPDEYVDERQKVDFNVYNPIFNQAKERLKNGGYFVMHLGKSKKCNMGVLLKEQSKKWFNHAELFDENVEHCNKFGIKDIGSVTSHQFLVMH